MSKRIEKSNKTFNQLTAAQKRVAIASDVLAQIDKRKIRGVHGTWVELELKAEAREKYLDGDNDDYYFDAEVEEVVSAPYNERQLDTILKEDTKVCHVCAIGGLFVCAVQRKNQIKLEECEGGGYVDVADADVALDGVVAMDYLRKFFSDTQLHLLELAFESGEGGENVSSKLVKVDEQSAIAFGQRFSNDTARLRAIMQNIVDNEGMFTPPVLPPSKMEKLREDFSSYNWY